MGDDADFAHSGEFFELGTKSLAERVAEADVGHGLHLDLCADRQRVASEES
jgi:hypothetical protein